MARDTVTQFRCALYARVSTKDKGQEVENQLRQLRDFAASSGWTIAAEFVDTNPARVPTESSSN